MIKKIALILLLLVPPAQAGDIVFRQPGNSGNYIPDGGVTAPPTTTGAIIQTCLDGTTAALCWGVSPVTGIIDATNTPPSVDQCRILKFYEFLDLDNPASNMCGIQIGDYLPITSTLWWRSQSVLTIDGTQTVTGDKVFNGAFSRSNELVSRGIPIGPILFTYATHATANTRQYFSLTGGVARSTTTYATATAPFTCTKLMRFNVAALDSAGVARTMPSSNGATFGFRVAGTDLGTAQTVSAATTGSTAAPSTTTGFTIDQTVMLWHQTTGSNTDANVQYLIWASCY